MVFVERFLCPAQLHKRIVRSSRPIGMHFRGGFPVSCAIRVRCSEDIGGIRPVHRRLR